MADFKLPHNLEAEAYIIAAMIGDREIIPDIIEILGDGGAFYSEANHSKYQQIVNLCNAGELIDMPGGGELGNARIYAKIVKEKAELRRVIGSATGLLNSLKIVSDDDNDIDDILDKLEKRYGI